MSPPNPQHATLAALVAPQILPLVAVDRLITTPSLGLIRLIRNKHNHHISKSLSTTDNVIASNHGDEKSHLHVCYLRVTS